MSPHHTGRRIVRIALVIAGLGLAPLGISESGVDVTDACGAEQTGTCCQETASICNAGGPEHNDYYYKSEGCCNPLGCH